MQSNYSYLSFFHVTKKNSKLSEQDILTILLSFFPILNSNNIKNMKAFIFHEVQPLPQDP